MNNENPTIYKGYRIQYVVNDVAPETLTACIFPPDHEGEVTSCTTSERVFRSRKEWHDDIRSKIDQHIEDHFPTRKMSQVSVRPMER